VVWEVFVRFGEVLVRSKVVCSNAKVINTATTLFHADEPESAVGVSVTSKGEQFLD
jgi:hypothetical protein